MTAPPPPPPSEAEPGDRVFTLTLAPHGWRVAAPAALTLREAAALAGIELPTSCRNGTCRFCIARMASGAVRYAVAWPGVSADEKREGWVLPCVAHAAADLVLEVPRARRAGAPPDAAGAG